MKRESAKQIAEERQRSAATRKKILFKAKGWMLIKSIWVMAIISTGHANFWRVLAPEKDALFEPTSYRIESHLLRTLNRPDRFLPSLMPGKSAREAEVLLRFSKVRLNAESLFVMGNGGVVFAVTAKYVRKLFMSDLKVRLH